VRRCIIKLESIIVKKGIEIEARFEEEEMQVCADIDAIERVLLNLIHNAIKFTPENGNIMIRTYPIKDKVAVTIKDNGTGIGQDEMDLIWERFYKSDKSRSKGGTG
ncbi:MAG: sensor histidine kinase, partial [Oscillospiraceae bacterium]|nr:sensor histidine kinase [Oscillospiraceae bacterium]